MLSTRQKTYKTKKTTPVREVSYYQAQVFVLCVDQEVRIPANHGHYDAAARTLHLVAKAKATDASALASTPSVGTHTVRIGTTISYPDFNSSVDPSKVYSLVKLVQVSGSRYGKRDEQTGVTTMQTSLGVEQTVVVHRFTGAELYAAFHENLPVSALRHRPPEAMFPGGVNTYPTQIMYVDTMTNPHQETAPGFIMSITDDDGDGKSFVFENADGPHMKLTMFLPFYQWERDFAVDHEEILVNLTLWEETCRSFGISSPPAWAKLGKFCRSVPFITFASVNHDRTLSMLPNDLRKRALAEGRPVIDTNSMRVQYDWGVTVSGSCTMFDPKAFYRRHLVPVDVQWVQTNFAVLSKAKELHQHNFFNNGMSGQLWDVLCLNEHEKCTEEGITEFMDLVTGGDGEFRVMPDRSVLPDDLERFSSMSTSEGAEYLSSVVASGGGFFYLFYMAKLQEREIKIRQAKRDKGLEMLKMYFGA